MTRLLRCVVCAGAIGVLMAWGGGTSQARRAKPRRKSLDQHRLVIARASMDSSTSI